MKSLTMTVAVGLAVIVVGFVAFIAQWMPTPSTKKPPEVPSKVVLEFPLIKVPEKQIGEVYSTTGHYDFWFRNPNSEPVELALEGKGCKCTRAEMLLLTAEEEKVWKACKSVSPPEFPDWHALAGPIASLSHRIGDFLGDKARWKEMKDPTSLKETIPLTVPPGSSGLIRMIWKGEEAKSPMQTLMARFGYQIQGRNESRSSVDFSVPILLMNPVIVETRTKEVGVVMPGETKTASFTCWSATRPNFSLTPSIHDAGTNPRECFSCECVPLSTRELQEVQQEKQEQEQGIMVASGYRVHVKVHERTPDGKKWLEIGALRCRVALASDAMVNPIVVEVRGDTMGEIRLLPYDLQNKLDLGAFVAEEDFQKTVLIEGDRDNMQLKVESTFPNYIKVDDPKLMEVGGGKKQWEMTVRIPAKQASGLLPVASEVVLVTQDAPPRRMRISVKGTANIDFGNQR